MRKANLIILFTFLLGATVWFLYRRSAVSALREEVRASETGLETLQGRIEKIRGELSPAQQAAASDRAARNRDMALLSAARATHAPGPDRSWAEPPAAWPEWETESPFVWVPKEVIKQLPITPFDSRGGIQPGVSAMLALSEEQRTHLSSALSAIVEDYQKLEVAHAHLTTNHLERGAGEKVTVILEPDLEAAARLEGEFEATLRRSVTAQQNEIVRALGRGWVSQNLRPESAEPKTFSAVRHPDGSFGVSIRRGHEWSSMSGGSKLEMYLPKHLMPFFAELASLDEGDSGQSAN